MTAERILRALGGRRAGAGWMAHCPAHNDGNPSLSIRESDDGKLLAHCHAGCDQKVLIVALRALGLWAEAGRRPASTIGLHRQGDRRPDAVDAQRTTAALAIWRSSVLATGTLVETYLSSRGLRLPAFPSLRFHGALKHSSGGAWPAMVGLVTLGSDNTPLGIHRTFLARNGMGKAQVSPSKMMLGPCCGGAVRLAELGDVLLVGEGIETTLAAMLATGHPAWAALSTSGLRALELPAEVHDVIVLADGDDAGKSAAVAAAIRWKRHGRRVRIASAPPGTDFNDLLMGRTTSSGKNAR